jgi:hypothetical protein
MQFNKIGVHDGMDLYGASTAVGNYVIVHDDGIWSATYKPQRFAEKVWLTDNAASFVEAVRACETHKYNLEHHHAH